MPAEQTPRFVYYPSHEDDSDFYRPRNSRGKPFVIYAKADYDQGGGYDTIADDDPLIDSLIEKYDLDVAMENTYVVPDTMTVDQMFAILANDPQFERITPCPDCLPGKNHCGY